MCFSVSKTKVDKQLFFYEERKSEICHHHMNWATQVNKTMKHYLSRHGPV